MTTMQRICESEAMGPEGRCRACGSPVTGYTANAALIALRPEAASWDWWVACDNVACDHHYGEGLFQVEPDWVEEVDSDPTR